MKHIFPLFCLMISGFLISACTQLREEGYKRIAYPVFMFDRVEQGGSLDFTVFERVYREGEKARIYIGGRDNMFLEEIIDDNTPFNPVGLEIASQDPWPNVIFMTLPCQYTGDGKDCPNEYREAGRFSEDVIDAYSEALNRIKYRYNLRSIHLVGYGDGGAIAALLAMKRPDIRSLRTIAAPLNLYASPKFNLLDRKMTALNPTLFAPSLQNMPQRHFLPELDNQNLIQSVYDYVDFMESNHCVNVDLVGEATNTENWAEQWQALLKLPVNCRQNPALIEQKAVPFDPKTLDDLGGKKTKK